MVRRSLVFVCLLGLLLTGCTANQPVVTDLGIPYETDYSAYKCNSRNPWDMIIVDGVLYVGGGDYGMNTGPVSIRGYTIEGNTWDSGSIVFDEAVTRFVWVDGIAMAPGIDSMGNWNWGHYHRLEEGRWKTKSTIPLAVHHFDIVRYGERMFYGIGTSGDKVSPVKYSTDDGDTFTDVPFYKNGQSLIGQGYYDFFRVYDFMVINDELYCLFMGVVDGVWGPYEIFCLEEEGFVFQTSLAEKDILSKQFWQDYMGPKLTWGDACYFTTGYLYRTEDFCDFSQVKPPDDGYVTDLLLEKSGLSQKERLYVLTTKRLGTVGYQNTVWYMTGESTMKSVVQFATPMSALSFAKQGRTFFVGLGAEGAVNEYVGKILKVDY